MAEGPMFLTNSGILYFLLTMWWMSTATEPSIPLAAAEVIAAFSASDSGPVCDLVTLIEGEVSALGLAGGGTSGPEGGAAKRYNIYCK